MNNDKLKLTLPWNEIEQGAQKQIENLLQYDFIKKLAIMPDVHQGYTMPIGGVGLFDNVISPECVGYDIGCGMSALITNQEFIYDDRECDEIRELIENVVPVGFEKNKIRMGYDSFVDNNFTTDELFKIDDKLSQQYGTLGGGNHFIEIGSDQNNNLAIVIHSGSRGAGWLVADKYMKLSKEKQKHLPKGFLNYNSELGLDYFDSMLFMTKYALENRKLMMHKIKNILNIFSDQEKLFINENHNFASVEIDGILHRKGATPAKLDQYGVIPGNMRDGTYITKGLGNREFLNCASHGAGRVGSRNWAKKNLDYDKFKLDMKNVSCKTEGRLDESPEAYKNIESVIAMQDGILVDVVNHITPKIVIKG